MKVALAAKPHNRIMLVTDAMPTAAGGPDAFELQGRRDSPQERKVAVG